MKTIINDDSKITTDIVEELCSIELTTDVVIVCPHSQINNDVVFEEDDFSLINQYELMPDTKGIYTFQPRMKLSLPLGLSLQWYCKVPGINILQHKIEKFRGQEFETTDIPVGEENDLKLSISCIRGQYTLYNKIVYHLTEFNRQLFIQYFGSRHGGLRIPPQQTVLGMYFMNVFVGGESKYFNEIYLIYSNYLYHRFPNF